MKLQYRCKVYYVLVKLEHKEMPTLTKQCISEYKAALILNSSQRLTFITFFALMMLSFVLHVSEKGFALCNNYKTGATM